MTKIDNTSLILDYLYNILYFSRQPNNLTTMRILIILFLILISKTAFSQSLSYYTGLGTPDWQSIAIIASPKNLDTGKMYHITSNSTNLDEIKQVKEVKDNAIHAAIVTIGSSNQKYLLIIPNDLKYLILSDERQIVKTIFTLDSKFLNPETKQSPLPTSELVKQLLMQGIKLLKYIP